jgi:hypothetical protein
LKLDSHTYLTAQTALEALRDGNVDFFNYLIYNKFVPQGGFLSPELLAEEANPMRDYEFYILEKDPVCDSNFPFLCPSNTKQSGWCTENLSKCNYDQSLIAGKRKKPRDPMKNKLNRLDSVKHLIEYNNSLPFNPEKWTDDMRNPIVKIIIDSLKWRIYF